MAEEKQTFGEQAARFSLYTPFAALAIGIFLIRSSDRDRTPFLLGVLNESLLLVGLILGIVALLLMRKHNPPTGCPFHPRCPADAHLRHHGIHRGNGQHQGRRP